MCVFIIFNTKQTNQSLSVIIYKYYIHERVVNSLSKQSIYLIKLIDLIHTYNTKVKNIDNKQSNKRNNQYYTINMFRRK